MQFTKMQRQGKVLEKENKPRGTKISVEKLWPCINSCGKK